MIRFWLIFLTLCQCITVSARAESGWFFGGGGGLTSFDDGADRVDVGNLVARGGYSLGGYLDIGAELGFTVLTDDINDVDHDLQTMFAFVKANLPVADDTSLYILVGATNIKLSESIRDSSVESVDDGVGVGIGVQVQSAPGSYYTVDYISYYDDDEFDISVGKFTAGAINFGFISYY